MANLVLAPVDWDQNVSGVVLTQTVPATGGCNLRCPFCLIAQRKEIISHRLQPHDYSRFISEVARERKVVGVAIQGYEPLLPEAMPYTRAILLEANLLAIPTSLVTNGVFLNRAVSELTELKPRRVGVSLDSASSEQHDRIRGASGAWRETVNGIEQGLKAFSSHRIGLQVISVMMPRRAAYLKALPVLLKQLGVSDWIVNPVMRIGNERAGGLFGATHEILRDLHELNAAATHSGIKMIVDDELGFLDGAIDVKAGALNIRTLPKGISLSRLTPGGQCSLGADIAQVQHPTAPRWEPAVIHAAQFLRSLEANCARIKQAA